LFHFREYVEVRQQKLVEFFHKPARPEINEVGERHNCRRSPTTPHEPSRAPKRYSTSGLFPLHHVRQPLIITRDSAAIAWDMRFI
jgi:hypothetical protein